MLLAMSGKFPRDGDYIDGRYTTDVESGVHADGRLAYNDIKEELGSNLGRMPVLACAAGEVGQSVAINYFLASELGLMGADHMEAATILAIQEHLKEMNSAFRTLVPYGSEPTKEAVDKWFEGGADDVKGAANMKTRSERFLRWFVGRIELQVGGDGYAVGGKPSLADALIFNAFNEHLSSAQAKETVKPFNREPFTSLSRTASVLKAAPKLCKVIANVEAHPGIQRWLAERGIQGF